MQEQATQMKLTIRYGALMGAALLFTSAPTFAQVDPVAAPVEAPVVIAPAPVVTPPAPVVTPAPAPTPTPQPTPAPKKVTTATDSLKPGQFIWEKRSGYNNTLRVVAVIDIQRLYVFDGDELVGFSTVSTGKKGHSTPTGVFKILQKKEYHESNLYSNAPMPFMQRLTWDGIALHAGKIPGYPASHGCIRLPYNFARALFGATKMDQEVVVLASLSKPAKPKPPVKPEPTKVNPVPPQPEQEPPVSDQPIVTPETPPAATPAN